MSGQVKEASIQYQIGCHSCDSEDSVEGRVCPPGYKQTEIGLIPKDWVIKNIDQITRNIIDYRGRTPKKLGMDWGGGEIVALSAGNVKKGFIDFDTDCYFGSEALYSRWMTTGDPQKNDIVFTLEAPLGNVALIPDDKKYILSQRAILLQINRESYKPEFLFQVMLSSDFQNYISDSATGSTAQGIKRKTFEKLKLSIPISLDEQIAIANALSDVDALITSLEKLIIKKRDIKTAAMQQLLTGKKRLPPFDLTHTGYKQTELGEIPEDWKVDILEKMSAFITKGSTPTTYGFSWEKDGVLFLRSECVSERGLDLYESMYISEKAHRVLKRSEVRSGDILITITGNVGRLIYLDEKVAEGNINQHIARVRITSENINSTYVFHYLSQKAVRKYFQSITTGQAYPQISLTQVRNTEIPYPSLKEQTAIANVLSDMDKEIDALQQRLNKTQQLKQGMMQELLTGRTRLI